MTPTANSQKHRLSLGSSSRATRAFAVTPPREHKSELDTRDLFSGQRQIIVDYQLAVMALARLRKLAGFVQSPAFSIPQDT